MNNIQFNTKNIIVLTLRWNHGKKSIKSKRNSTHNIDFHIAQSGYRYLHWKLNILTLVSIYLILFDKLNIYKSSIECIIILQQQFLCEISKKRV